MTPHSKAAGGVLAAVAASAAAVLLGPAGVASAAVASRPAATPRPAAATPRPAAATPRPAEDIAVGAHGVHVSRPVIRPGRVHVRNVGSRPALLIAAKHGAGVARIVAELDTISNPATTPRTFDVITTLGGGRDAYLPIHRGHTYVLDPDRTHFRAGDLGAIAVTGPAADAPVPAAPTLTIGPRGRMTVLRQTLPSSGYVRVQNDHWSDEAVVCFHVIPGVSDATLRRALADPTPQRLSQVIDLAGGNLIAMVPGRTSIRAGYRVVAGRHVLFAIGETTTPPLSPDHLRLFPTD